jgi:hypothetical protein
MVQGFALGSTLLRKCYSCGFGVAPLMACVGFSAGSLPSCRKFAAGSYLVQGWLKLGSCLVHCWFVCGSLLVRWWFIGGSPLLRYFCSPCFVIASVIMCYLVSFDFTLDSVNLLHVFCWFVLGSGLIRAWFDAGS